MSPDRRLGAARLARARVCECLTSSKSVARKCHAERTIRAYAVAAGAANIAVDVLKLAGETMAECRSANAGSGVRVAIVDDGVFPQHPYISNLAGGARVDVDGQTRVEVRETDHTSRSPWSHGTVCAALVSHRVPKADLYSVKILNGRGRAHPVALATAIQWCVDHGIHVINLSLGTTSDAHAPLLRSACVKAAERGVIIVASTHIAGLISYPSVFPETIGVGKDDRYQEYEYGYYPTRIAEFVAAGRDDLAARIMNALAEPEINVTVANGTSLAAPRVTANVVALLAEARSLDLGRVKDELGIRETRLPMSRNYEARQAREGATPERSASSPRSPVDTMSIRRAAIYPYDREVEPLVTFRDLFDFEIRCVVDPVHSSAHGRDAGEIYGRALTGLPVLPDLDEVPADVDALILGPTGAMQIGAHQDVLLPALHWAAEHAKNVFSLAPIEPHVYRDLYAQAACSGLRWDSSSECAARCAEPDSGAWESLELEYDVDCPIVGVFGTSHNQGKLTAQLALRRWLQREGYQVGHVGGNPVCGLLANGVCVPWTPAPVAYADYVAYVRTAVATVFQSRPHIIVAGGEGGVVPPMLYNLHDAMAKNRPTDYTLPAIAFLMGSKPDALVLTINTTDDEAYVERSISALEAVSQKPVVALTFADKLVHTDHYTFKQRWGRTLSPAEVGRLRERYADRFGRPVYCHDVEEQQEEMVGFLIDALAAE